MDRFSQAAGAFSEAEEHETIEGPIFSRSPEQHARILRSSASLTAVDAGLALIARRSNGALGVIKTVALRYDHPGMSLDAKRWVVSVRAEEDYEVSMVELDSGEERSATLKRTDASGIPRDPERGLDLARALLERDLQASSSGLVLADGSLSAQLPEERAACAKLGSNVLGIVKRSSLARKGSSPEALCERSFEGVFAHELEGAHYCRLHPLGRVLRVEGELDDERFDALLLASSDAAVPGYPYALVLADRFARISNREARALALEAHVRHGLAIGSLHDVLDSLER